jgi:hypothetical protein
MQNEPFARLSPLFPGQLWNATTSFHFGVKIERIRVAAAAVRAEKRGCGEGGKFFGLPWSREEVEPVS